MFKDTIIAFFLGITFLYSCYWFFPNEEISFVTSLPLAIFIIFSTAERKFYSYLCFTIGATFSNPILSYISIPTNSPKGYYTEAPNSILYMAFIAILMHTVFYDFIITYAIKLYSYIKKTFFNKKNDRIQKYEGSKNNHKFYQILCIIVLVNFIVFIAGPIRNEFSIEKLDIFTALIISIPFLTIFLSYKNSMSLKSINYDSITINFLFLKRTIPFTKIKDLEQIPAENFREPRELGGFTMRTNSRISYTVFHDANDDVFPTIADRITQGDTKCRTAATGQITNWR